MNAHICGYEYAQAVSTWAGIARSRMPPVVTFQFASLSSSFDSNESNKTILPFRSCGAAREGGRGERVREELEQRKEFKDSIST
jgi:hypothetical protein